MKLAYQTVAQIRDENALNGPIVSDSDCEDSCQYYICTIGKCEETYYKEKEISSTKDTQIRLKAKKIYVKFFFIVAS